jgi:hypothetical protein
MQLDMTNTFLLVVCIMHKVHILPYLHVGYMRSLIMMIVSMLRFLAKRLVGAWFLHKLYVVE